MTKRKILSTKSLEPSLIQKAKEQGFEIIVQEAINIRPILSKEKWDEIFSLLEKKLTYAVFTSSNSVLTLKKYLNEYVNHLPAQWKIFCLSGKTKTALMHAEELFGSIEGTANDATALAELMLKQDVKEILFFCGSKRRDELPDRLKAHGVVVHEVVVYETVETSFEVNDTFDGMLFFSPSAVESFFSVNQLKKETVCFAIGQTTADAIAAVTNNLIVTSKFPSQEDLLASVISYFQNSD